MGKRVYAPKKLDPVQSNPVLKSIDDTFIKPIEGIMYSIGTMLGGYYANSLEHELQKLADRPPVKNAFPGYGSVKHPNIDVPKTKPPMSTKPPRKDFTVYNPREPFTQVDYGQMFRNQQLMKKIARGELGKPKKKVKFDKEARYRKRKRDKAYTGLCPPWKSRSVYKISAKKKLEGG